MSLIVIGVVVVFVLGAGSGFWMAWHLRGRPRTRLDETNVAKQWREETGAKWPPPNE